METIAVLFLILSIPAFVVSIGPTFVASAMRQSVRAGFRLGLIGLTTFSVLMMTGCGIVKSNPLHSENVEAATKPGDSLLSCEQLILEYYRAREDLVSNILPASMISGLTLGVKKPDVVPSQTRMILLADRYDKKYCHEPELEYLIFGRFIIAPQPGSPEAQELLSGLSDADKNLSCEEIPSAIMEEKSAIAEGKVSPIIVDAFFGQRIEKFTWPPPVKLQLDMGFAFFAMSDRLQGLFALEQDKQCAAFEKTRLGVE